MMDEHEAVKRTGHTINDYRYIYPRVSVKIMAQYWLVPVSFNRQNYFGHNQLEIYQYKLAVTVTRLGEIGKLGSVDGQLCCWSVGVMSQTYRTVLKSSK